MRKGNVYSFFGDGRVRVSLAVGFGMRAVSENLQVIIIQFLEASNTKERELIKKFEPDLKLFRFNKLSDEPNQRTSTKDAEYEVMQAFNFARKVIDTGECDVLILDGIVEAINKGFLQATEVNEIINKKDDYMEIAIIGKKIPDNYKNEIDSIVYEFAKNSEKG